MTNSLKPSFASFQLGNFALLDFRHLFLATLPHERIISIITTQQSATRYQPQEMLKVHIHITRKLDFKATNTPGHFALRVFQSLNSIFFLCENVSFFPYPAIQFPSFFFLLIFSPWQNGLEQPRTQT